MLRNILKFSGMGIAIVAFGVGVIFGVDYVKYRAGDEYRAIKEIEKLKKEYAEDPYGGDTPEETLRLFIDALKKGDTDLAAKYFVFEEQEEWKTELVKIKEKGLLGEMVADLERTKKSGEDNQSAFFTTVNSEDIVSVLVDLRRHRNGKWKIQDL